MVSSLKRTPLNESSSVYCTRYSKGVNWERRNVREKENYTHAPNTCVPVCASYVSGCLNFLCNREKERKIERKKERKRIIVCEIGQNVTSHRNELE